jgi:23S rRNA (adenine1618-N6)-methyltransferase
MSHLLVMEKTPQLKKKKMAPGSEKGAKQTSFHPRNRHQGRYDFPAMIKQCPPLAAFVITNSYGNLSIDFANPTAVRVLNQALLQQLYGIDFWQIPPGYLCPPIPGRADYIHGLADLLATGNHNVIPRGDAVRVLDVGVGANCIYPILGRVDYGWQFVACDVDAKALVAAQKIVQKNPSLNGGIELRQQPDSAHIFAGVIRADDLFDLTLCNPPFHSSAEEASFGSARKWRNLGLQDPARKLPKLNFGGQQHELWCKGGEASFVRSMIRESAQHAAQVFWFTSLISKAGNLPDLQFALKKSGAKEVRVVPMAQGQKQSRFLAWTFLDLAQREQWAQRQWSAT